MLIAEIMAAPVREPDPEPVLGGIWLEDGCVEVAPGSMLVVPFEIDDVDDRRGTAAPAPPQPHAESATVITSKKSEKNSA
jgi:hypothetical protein